MTPARATDAQLLEAGRRAVSRLGAQGATLERIAEEAGVSRATLHRRGVSRELILGRLAEEAVEAYRRALWPALTSAGSGRERLEAALNALCAVAEGNLELLLALGGHTDAVFHDDAQEAMTRTPFTEPLERLLLDGAADGTLRALEPREYATVLFNLVGWTYIHLRARHHWPPERARDATLDIALHGLVIAAPTGDAALYRSEDRQRHEDQHRQRDQQQAADHDLPCQCGGRHVGLRHFSLTHRKLPKRVVHTAILTRSSDGMSEDRASPTSSTGPRTPVGSAAVVHPAHPTAIV